MVFPSAFLKQPYFFNMIQRLLFTCMLMLPLCMQGQTKTYDIVGYQIPSGWKKDSAADYISFSDIQSAKKSWCKITIYKSVASAGEVEKDFDADWKQLIEKTYQPSGVQKAAPVVAKAWSIQSGSGQFQFNQAPAIISLTTLSNSSRYLSIVAMTNDAGYEDDIIQFIASLQLPETDIQTATGEQLPPIQPSTSVDGKYQFSSTNWDDGWTSTIQPQWVEVSKPGIRVLLHHQSPEQVEAGWQTLVLPRYRQAQITLQDYGTPTSAGMTYFIIGGTAVDQSSGKNVFIALFRGDGGNRVIEVVADREDIFTKEFATVVTETLPWDPSKSKTIVYWNKINAMYGKNRFAIGPNDLLGTWYSADTVGLGNSSRYSSAATNLITINTKEYQFINGTQYQYIEGNGSGTNTQSNNVRLIYQTSKGSYAVRNWEIDLQQESFGAYFMAIPNGRLLVLFNNQGSARVYSKRN